MARPNITKTFSADGTLALPGEEGIVNRWLVHFESTSGTNSCTPSGRVIGGASTLSAVELAWYNMNTGAVVAAGAAPTADALMLIDATGLDVLLTIVTDGSVTITAHQVVG